MNLWSDLQLPLLCVLWHKSKSSSYVGFFFLFFPQIWKYSPENWPWLETGLKEGRMRKSRAAFALQRCRGELKKKKKADESSWAFLIKLKEPARAWLTLEIVKAAVISVPWSFFAKGKKKIVYHKNSELCNAVLLQCTDISMLHCQRDTARIKNT